MRLYITGFGKFGHILSNPTTALVNVLPGFLKAHPIKNMTLADHKIVTVACEFVDDA